MNKLAIPDGGIIQDSRNCELFSLITFEVNVLDVTALLYIASQYNNKKSENKPDLSCHHLHVWLLHYCVTNDIKIISYGCVCVVCARALEGCFGESCFIETCLWTDSL